jgi:hypothetical protein
MSDGIDIKNGTQGLHVVHVTIPSQQLIQASQPSVIHTAGGVQTIQVVRVCVKKKIPKTCFLVK